MCSDLEEIVPVNCWHRNCWTYLWIYGLLFSCLPRWMVENARLSWLDYVLSKCGLICSELAVKGNCTNVQ